MKKYIFLSLIIFIVLGTKAQRGGHFIFGTTIGTGIALSTPESTPFTWSLLGYYSIGRRFSAGIGTGLSFYEKTVIPLFVTAKFTLLPPPEIYALSRMWCRLQFCSCPQCQRGVLSESFCRFTIYPSEK